MAQVIRYDHLQTNVLMARLRGSQVVDK